MKLGRSFSLRCFLFLIFFALINAETDVEEEIVAQLEANISIPCNLKSEIVLWKKDDNNITKSNKRYQMLKNVSSEGDELTSTGLNYLQISNVQLLDKGNFSCHSGSEAQHSFLEPVLPAEIVANSNEIKTNQSVTLYCLVKGYPIERYKPKIKWHREDEDKEFSVLQNLNTQIHNNTKLIQLNDTFVNVTLEFQPVSKKDNGTYICSIDAKPTVNKDRIESSILVTEVPQVSIDYVKAVGANKIFMNWTIMDGHDPIKMYYVQYMKEGTPTFHYYIDRIAGFNNSYVLENFEPDTNYLLKIYAQNSIGVGPVYQYPNFIKTLKTDPSFVPKIEVKGNTHTTVTIGWTPPPLTVLEYIQYYEVVVASANDNSSVIEEAIHPQNSRNLPYMFDNLKTATEYIFKVRACSELTKLCGNWSEIVSGITMDGTSSEPLGVQVICSHFNISRRNTVTVSWEPPTETNGKIITYQVDLRGIASYKSDRGGYKVDNLGVKSKHVAPVEGLKQKTEFEGVQPNTNYTVSISAITRSKRTGEYAYGTCTMPATTPDTIGKLMWGKIKTEIDHWIFKLFLPIISERNGPICCYRIYLVRVGESQSQHLEPPENLDVMTYHEVHAANNTKGGAYIAEVMSSDTFQTEVFLGDGKNLPKSNNSDYEKFCKSCLSGIVSKQPWKRPKPTPIAPIVGLSELPHKSDTDSDINQVTTEKSHKFNEIMADKGVNRKRRQQIPDSSINPSDVLYANPTSISIDGNTFEIFDGELDVLSNYTGFVEVVIQNENGNNPDNILSTFSEYFQMMSAGAPHNSGYENDDSLSSILNIVVQVLCALIVLVLILVIALCILHRYYTKYAIPGDEVISLRDSLSRALCGGRSNNNHHRHLIGSSASKPPDIAPISKQELPQAYVARHKDSDYGFQHEFEMLPDRFTDRTTKNSDCKENVYKNRYPDIKSYDQTRVKLSFLNSVLGTDYINANFVLGYKERKKFICAQGPMDGTINDFWRMIWEQHLEIIVMLTNLEEYNKTKCAKYWPEKIGEPTQFGDIVVTFATEHRFADYLVRDLRVVKRNQNQDGDDEEIRTITQYHYLMWKDFMAPEHPHGIIKFIKQINSVYSLQRGPILVHCSAGVGRTGTLVALDSLIQQIKDEGQVSIFNTVCDMRHQRNFLVQSLKQYIFLYRSLMEIAQFGDTELSAKDLGPLIDALKTRPNDSKEQCELELEYEKLKSVVDDTKKTSAVGNGEENRCKNRSDMIIPFDRNRVILLPVPGRENSTYINATFIEGYDNSESFIITQDPLENTITDFWRMISEQGIKTIVMLSEIGDGARKCPRYWADDEIQLDHILVKYIQSESCPYYTRREFNVINCKNNDTNQVTQFQYNGWPTVEGEVPEVTRGMIELVDQSQKYHNSEDEFTHPGAMVVHCSLGSDRSSIFVAMCIIVQQLRTEKKVDICTTVRKLRSQRNMLIDSYAQYEFLHRAIVNYADLHRLSLDLPSEC